MKIKKYKKKKYKKKKYKKKKKKKLSYLSIFIFVLIIITITIFILYGKRLFLTKNIKYTNINNQINITEIIDQYLLPIPQKFDEDKKEERMRLEAFLSLKNLPKDKKDPFYLEEKSKLLKSICEIVKKILLK